MTLRLPPPVSDELGATSPQNWNARPAERHSSVANRSRPLALIEGVGFERACKLDGDDDAIRRPIATTRALSGKSDVTSAGGALPSALKTRWPMTPSTAAMASNVVAPEIGLPRLCG